MSFLFIPCYFFLSFFSFFLHSFICSLINLSFLKIFSVTDFENSSMKNSFSMSSLQPSSRICLEQSSQTTNNSSIPALPNRAYNSLTHKLRLIFYLCGELVHDVNLNGLRHFDMFIFSGFPRFIECVFIRSGKKFKYHLKEKKGGECKSVFVC